MSTRAALKDTFSLWASFVAFPHTVFAFPFALSMLLLISRVRPVLLVEFLWIVIALVSARTAAMAFNRIIDRHIDARNPRTKMRELPRGALTVRSASLLFVTSTLFFLFAAYALGVHCFILAPLVLAFLCFYSWSKRVTRYSHILLGIALALAPGGVWFALTATFATQPLLLMAAVALWVAGFDIIYSCQDVDFDRAERLYSIPARVGIGRALTVARTLHFLTVLLLAWFGSVMDCGLSYYAGLFFFAAALFHQHRLVSESDLSKVNQAFFTTNGLASIVFMLGVLADTISYSWGS